MFGSSTCTKALAVENFACVGQGYKEGQATVEGVGILVIVGHDYYRSYVIVTIGVTSCLSDMLHKP